MQWPGFLLIDSQHCISTTSFRSGKLSPGSLIQAPTMVGWRNELVWPLTLVWDTRCGWFINKPCLCEDILGSSLSTSGLFFNLPNLGMIGNFSPHLFHILWNKLFIPIDHHQVVVDGQKVPSLFPNSDANSLYLVSSSCLLSGLISLVLVYWRYPLAMVFSSSSCLARLCMLVCTHC